MMPLSSHLNAERMECCSFVALLSEFRLADWATYPIVLLSVDRNLKAIAANSPADAARLQQEERLRTPVFRGISIAPRPNLSGIGTDAPS